jgi:predicted N-formylglutamate amidohydrolase
MGWFYHRALWQARAMQPPSRPSTTFPESIPGILDVVRFAGTASPGGAPPDLVIEVPHGATRTEDFRALEAMLRSPLPDQLVDFFHVNTDAGAPELAMEAARRLVAAAPARTVALLRCRIPRTFIDCNRRMDASPEEFKAGKVTPGLMPWITAPEDRELLLARYHTYVGAVRAASEGLAAGGAMLLLHTYAPRTVGVEVDLQIVENLHRAYLPDVEPTWPLRPEIDVIGRAPDGTAHAPAQVVEALRQAMRAVGVTVADGETYPLHPSTLAWEHVMRHPGRALCAEVRRDLLADPFQPFAEMRIGEAQVARLAGPLAEALLRWW